MAWWTLTTYLFEILKQNSSRHHVWNKNKRLHT